MAHLFEPFLAVFDGNGAPRAGAKLYFYTTGTSTPLDTYSQSDLDPSHVNTNPVEADADGLFPPIYMPTTSTYKIILKTSADATIATRDPYSPTTVSFADGATNGQIPMARSASTPNGYVWVSALTKHIRGLTYSNNVSDATNDIDIAAGGCMDSTGVEWIEIAATTKQLDQAWAADNGATPTGGLSTGAIANVDYYLHAIKNPTTGLTGVLFDVSTTPTLPSGYTLFRLFGWIKRSGGAIVAFKTYEMEGGGLQYLWNAVAADVSLSNTLTTTRRTDALRVPLLFAVNALFVAAGTDASSNFSVWIYCPDMSDQAVGSAIALPAVPNLLAQSAGNVTAQLRIRTSTTGTVASRADLATVDGYVLQTVGFEWSRR